MSSENELRSSWFTKSVRFLSYISFQNMIRQIFFASVLGGTVWLSIKLIKSVSADAAAAGSNDFLLFISSALMSWLISAWFSTFTSSDKIDTVAEQSFDKMRNATVQLGQVQLFLENTVSKGRTLSLAGDTTQSVALMEHRMSGAIDMLKLISNSNEAVSSDWLGVVSAPVQRRLRDKMSELRRFTDVIDNPVAHDGENTDAFEGIPGAQRVVQSRKGDTSDLGPAAIVSQARGAGSSSILQKGQLHIEVIRRTFSATGSGKFSESMDAVPTSNQVKLVKYPDNVEVDKISHKFGIGTKFDFNINLRSTEYNTPLPIGEYVFEYCAEVTDA